MPDPSEALSDFSAQWCQDLLNSPDYAIIELDNRRPVGQPANKVISNTLFSAAWKTPTTVPAFISLRGKTVVAPNIAPDFLLLASLGTDVGGYRNIAHGGAMMAILDQALGMSLTIDYGPKYVTQEIGFKLRKSFRLPGIALCRITSTTREGARIRVKGTLEDELGKVCLEGDAVFSAKRAGKL